MSLDEASVKVPPMNNDFDHIFPTAYFPIPMAGKVTVSMLERKTFFIIYISPIVNMKIDTRQHIWRSNLLLVMGILFNFVLLWLRQVC